MLISTEIRRGTQSLIPGKETQDTSLKMKGCGEGEQYRVPEESRGECSVAQGHSLIKHEARTAPKGQNHKAT